MRIFFAGTQGSEFKSKKLLAKISPKRLVSYHYMTPGQTKGYLGPDSQYGDDGRIMMDSGAFSAWSQGVEVCIDKYIEYLLEHQDKLATIVNLDVIPSKKGKNRVSASAIEESAKKGFDNYNKMIAAGLPKKKVVHVFHQRERFYWLEKMAAEAPYIGLSPIFNKSTPEKMVFLDSCMPFVTDSGGFPTVKFHGFAVTSHRLIERYPWWTVDSSSWGVQAGMGTVYMPRFLRGKWDFSERDCVEVSFVGKNKNSFDNLSTHKKELILNYLESVGSSLGQSKFRVFSSKETLKKNWKKVLPGTALNLGYRLSGDEVLGEKIIEVGARNSHQERYLLNAFFINEYEKTLPKYPWAFAKKQPVKLF